MKNFKTGLLCLVIVATVGFAFATSPKANLLNNYIPVQTSSGFTWAQLTVSNPISNYNCVTGTVECAQFSGSSAPADNSYPSGFSNQGKVYVHK